LSPSPRSIVCAAAEETVVVVPVTVRLPLIVTVLPLKVVFAVTVKAPPIVFVGPVKVTGP